MAISKTQKAKAQLKLDLENIYNLKADRYGHYLFRDGLKDRLYRIKFQANTWRFETSMGSGKGWLRLRSNTYVSDKIDVLVQYLCGCKQGRV